MFKGPNNLLNNSVVFKKHSTHLAFVEIECAVKRLDVQCGAFNFYSRPNRISASEGLLADKLKQNVCLMVQQLSAVTKRRNYSRAMTLSWGKLVVTACA